MCNTATNKLSTCFFRLHRKSASVFVGNSRAQLRRLQPDAVRSASLYMPRRPHRTRARIGQEVAVGPKPGVGSGSSYIRAARCHPPGPNSRPGLEEAGPQTALCNFRHTRSSRAMPLCVLPANFRGGHPTGSPGAQSHAASTEVRVPRHVQCAQDAQRRSSAGAKV